MEDAENWLYEEGEDCEKQVYTEKLRELRLKGEPIKKRKEEFDARPGAIETLGRSLQQVEKALGLYNSGDEKYAHIDKADMDKVANAVVEKRKWMDDNSSVLLALDKTLNPPVLVAQFYSEKSAFESIVNPILNKPKPKVEPPPKEEKKEGEKEKQDQQQQPQEQQVNGDGQNMELD